MKPCTHTPHEGVWVFQANFYLNYHPKNHVFPEPLPLTPSQISSCCAPTVLCSTWRVWVAEQPAVPKSTEASHSHTQYT